MFLLCVDALLKDIEICRKKLVDLASLFPLSHKKVIKTSTELDALLNQYQEKTAKKRAGKA